MLKKHEQIEMLGIVYQLAACNLAAIIAVYRRIARALHRSGLTGVPTAKTAR